MHTKRVLSTLNALDAAHFEPYVKKADRLKNASLVLKTLTEKGKTPHPIELLTFDEKKFVFRQPIANLWCTTLEKRYYDPIRIERGKAYLRNGALIHLEVEKPNQLFSLVNGSTVYHLRFTFSPMSPEQTLRITSKPGRFDELARMLLPKNEDTVTSSCTCPDFKLSKCCKHMFATIYGFGIELDRNPRILFRLRGFQIKT